MSEAKASIAPQKEQKRTAKETWNILLDYAGRWSWLIWVSIIAAAPGTEEENESKTQVDISELTRGKIVLMIAHRMRTIVESDYIVGLNGGKVVETGAR